MPRIPRSDILARFHAMKARGEPIIGAGAGTGLSAKGEEAGGADLIVIYNSGRYRMAGRGSLAGMMPYGDANGIVVEMAREVLPVVARTPVLAGVCGTDPFRADGCLSGRGRAARLQRRAEFPDRRADRRPLPRRARRDGHGLWPRGRDDRQGARARSSDDALRLRSVGGGGDGAAPAPTSWSVISA